MRQVGEMRGKYEMKFVGLFYFLSMSPFLVCLGDHKEMNQQSILLFIKNHLLKNFKLRFSAETAYKY